MARHRTFALPSMEYAKALPGGKPMNNFPFSWFIPIGNVGDFTKSCNGKNRYTTPQARAVVQRMKENGDTNIWFYRCPKCHKTHVGHRSGHKQLNKNQNPMHNFIRAEIRITRKGKP